MERLDEQAAIARLEMDVAHRAQAEAAAGFEAVEQTLSRAGLRQLFLVGPEGFFFDRLEGEASSSSFVVPLMRCDISRRRWGSG